MDLFHNLASISARIFLVILQFAANIISSTEANFDKEEVTKTLTYLNDSMYAEGFAKSWMYLSLIECDEETKNCILECFSFIITITSRLIGKSFC
jgi:hypothetical protein